MARAVFVNETIGAYNGSYDPRYDVEHSGGKLAAAKLTLVNPVLSAGTPLNADNLNNLYDFDNLGGMKGNTRTTTFSGSTIIEEIKAAGSSAVNARRETTFPTGTTMKQVTTVYNDAGTAALRTTTVTTTFGATISEVVS